MSVTRQPLLGGYRAGVHGERSRPRPAGTTPTVRELRDCRRFHVVIAERPARGRMRYALRRWPRLRAAWCAVGRGPARRRAAGA